MNIITRKPLLSLWHLTTRCFPSMYQEYLCAAKFNRQSRQSRLRPRENHESKLAAGSLSRWCHQCENMWKQNCDCCINKRVLLRFAGTSQSGLGQCEVPEECVTFLRSVQTCWLQLQQCQCSTQGLTTPHARMLYREFKWNFIHKRRISRV